MSIDDDYFDLLDAIEGNKEAEKALEQLSKHLPGSEQMDSLLCLLNAVTSSWYDSRPINEIPEIEEAIKRCQKAFN